MPDPSSPSSTPYFATPRQPRLIWNDRDKRKATEPLPIQTVEIICAFSTDHRQGGLDLVCAISSQEIEELS